MIKLYRMGLLMTLLQKVCMTVVQNYSTGINWSNAFMKCGNNGLERDLSVLSNLKELQQEDFWIGIIQYREITPWINPVGCYRFWSNGRSTTKLSSVGECLHKCNSSKHFGFQESTHLCHCFKCVGINPTNKVNLSSCGRQTNTIMVYRRFDFSESDYGIKKCMVSFCNGANINLSPKMCNATDSSIKAVCDDLRSPYTTTTVWGLNYTKATELCLKDEKTLLSPQECPSVLGIHAWTSTFRQEILVDYYIKTTKNMSEEACLSGKRNKSAPHGINKTWRSCTDELQLFACRSNTSKYQEMSENCTHERVISAKTTNIGPLVGGLIGGGTTILVVILLIFWIQRKRHTQATPSKETYSRSSKPKVSTDKHATNMHYNCVRDLKTAAKDNSTVDKEAERPNKYTPQYAIVKKENKPIPSEEVYVVSSKEEYDKLNNVSSRKNTTEKNIYGITGQCCEGEYDTMNRILGAKENHDDNLYDTNIST